MEENVQTFGQHKRPATLNDAEGSPAYPPQCDSIPSPYLCLRPITAWNNKGERPETPNNGGLCMRLGAVEPSRCGCPRRKQTHKKQARDVSYYCGFGVVQGLFRFSRLHGGILGYVSLSSGTASRERVKTGNSCFWEGLVVFSFFFSWFYLLPFFWSRDKKVLLVSNLSWFRSLDFSVQERCHNEI